MRLALVIEPREACDGCLGKCSRRDHEIVACWFIHYAQWRRRIWRNWEVRKIHNFNYWANFHFGISAQLSSFIPPQLVSLFPGSIRISDRVAASYAPTLDEKKRSEIKATLYTFVLNPRFESSMQGTCGGPRP